MLRAMHSPDSSDSHVRQLLDERSARTGALRYSEGDDTPSVYSPACFSPRQADKPSSSSRLLDDPSSSVLDFDEDVRSSVVPSVACQDDKLNQDDGSDQDSLTRMSYLGPKMRFHSRAPWELEEDALEDVDETASTAHSGQSGLMGMLTGSRGRPHKADSSSSPRPSTATSRPSAESSRSFLNSKRSFDTSMSSTTHPRGTLYALAQESLSTSSLGRPHYSGRQEGPRGKFSLGRLRSHSSTLDVPSSPNDSATRLPLPTIPSPSPRASCDTTNSSTLDVQTGLNALFVDRRIDKGFHPYASPELVSYSEPLPPKSPIRSNPQYPEVPRKDPNSTVVEVSAFSGPAKLLTTSTPTPETSKRRVSHIQGKEISSPVNVLPVDSPIHLQPDEPVLLPRVIPGWTERNINPGFSLISLEEARAQRRGTTIPSPKTKTHEASSSGDSSTTTAVETSTSLTSDANHSQFAASRARARSISAGAKAKNVLSSLVRQPERRGSENGFVTGLESSHAKDNAITIASKSVKHKKSGFMRLFGNGRVNEKEPPPVPPPPSAQSLPQSEAPAFALRHNPKLSSHRIPVPSLSPSLLEAATRLEGTHQSGDSDVIDISRSSASSKRSLPHILTISTGSSPLQISPRGHFAGFGKDEPLPQSAPADIGDFPTLKLRPVSTLFSAHFGDHIDVTKLNFDEEESVGPKETKEDVMARRRETERPRLDSLASISVSSGPSSASATSSQYNLSPIAPSFAGTTLTTPTTGGILSPTSSSTTGPPWTHEHEHVLGGGRFSTDQQSTPPSLSPNASSSSHVLRDKDVEATTTIKVLQEHLDNTNKMWQKRVWDLENEVRRLKNELAGLKLQKHNEGCDKCGNGIPPVPPLPSKLQQQQMLKSEDGASGVMNRPRAKTGNSARFVNGQI